LAAGLFPFIGSRSPLLGLAVSLLTFFWLLRIKETFRLKKSSHRIYIGAGILILGAVLFLLFRYSILAERYIILTNNAFGRDSLGLIFTGKLELWTVAGLMIRDFPLTGVGLGSFIVELANYGQGLGWSLFRNYADSAENLYLHVGAELGLIGLALMIWLFWEIIKKAKSGWSAFTGASPNRFLFLGAVCTVECFFINYNFHSYMGSYEVNYAFWLLAAVLFILVRLEKKSREPLKPRRRLPFVLAAAVLGLIFGGFHLWNSLHSLSLENRADTFHWNQNYGLYQEETDAAGFPFRWTQRSAGITIDRLGPVAVIPMMASHPDIEENPVKVKIYLGKPDFTKGMLIRELELKNHSWIETRWDVSDIKAKRLFFILESSRAWSPRHDWGVPDSRSLAIGLGDIWFKYPSDIPRALIRRHEEIPPERWQGSQKHTLLKNGESSISFEARSACFLRLKLKGTKALGVGPRVLVRLDGELLAKTYLVQEDWTSLALPDQVQKGKHVISVAFANDLYFGQGADRNLTLGNLEIFYPGPVKSR
jgi:hypothetical protein